MRKKWYGSVSSLSFLIEYAAASPEQAYIVPAAAGEIKASAICISQSSYLSVKRIAVFCPEKNASAFQVWDSFPLCKNHKYRIADGRRGMQATGGVLNVGGRLSGYGQ